MCIQHPTPHSGLKETYIPITQPNQSFIQTAGSSDAGKISTSLTVQEKAH